MRQGPEGFAEAFNVSRETMERLKIYDELLLRWNAKINLVGPSTIPQRWSRHFADSAQLIDHIPDSTRTLVDLGSGAGFPGLVIAAFNRPGGRHIQVTLIESDIRKTVFLQTVAREMGVEVTIQAERIEQVPAAPHDVIVSRALAPVSKLLHYAARFARPGSICRSTATS